MCGWAMFATQLCGDLGWYLTCGGGDHSARGCSAARPSNQVAAVGKYV